MSLDLFLYCGCIVAAHLTMKNLLFQICRVWQGRIHLWARSVYSQFIEKRRRGRVGDCDEENYQSLLYKDRGGITVKCLRHTKLDETVGSLPAHFKPKDSQENLQVFLQRQSCEIGLDGWCKLQCPEAV